MRCMRCRGLKKLYRVNQTYTTVDTGGEYVDCPMCLGEGKVKALDELNKELKRQRSKKKMEVFDE